MEQQAPGKQNFPIRYLYVFTFTNGAKKEFKIDLDPTTLNLTNEAQSAPPDWASLNFFPCDGCSLDRKKHTHCPIAANIAELVKSFHDVSSSERVLVTVETPERTVSKTCPVETGLHSLLGIYMVASGCPVMQKLKPMIRFHSPFASIDETMYRVFSMYLTAQYYRSKNGLKPDWTLEGLSNLYREINDVNVRLSQRIAKAFAQDATFNALVSLDMFTHFFQGSMSDATESFGSLFQPYLEPDAKTKN